MSRKFGAFGKIPALGDFLRMDLSAGFVQPWDEWLQTGIIDVKESLGERWTETYMSAPIWRFTLPQGVAGPQAMSGILMASVDRVGRQYPLTLAAPHGTQNTAQIHFANTTTFERLEDIALRALDDDFQRDMLAPALETVSIVEPAPVTDLTLPYSGPAPAAQVLAAQFITQNHRSAPSLWSTAMEGDHRLMACQGLPQTRDLHALFDIASTAWTTSKGTQYQ